jgi:hypothetical protein
MNSVLVLELLENDYKNAWNFTSFNYKIRIAVFCIQSVMTLILLSGHQERKFVSEDTARACLRNVCMSFIHMMEQCSKKIP